MSTNLPQYDRVFTYCRQLLPTHRITRVRNLAWLMLGLLSSTDAHLASLAEVLPLAAADLSVEQRLRRFLDNEHIEVSAWFAPFVRAALSRLAPSVVYVVLDTTQFGPSCRALLAGLAYAGQVLPLGWRIVKGKKGHTDAALHNELLAEIRPYLPPGARVVLVADSEFSAVEGLSALTDWGWDYIVRVRGSVFIEAEGQAAQALSAYELCPGQTRVWRDIRWSQKHRFGPVMAIGTWQVGEKEPLYVLTNTHDEDAALRVYDWRFWIEPLFGDFKGRGFRLGHTRLRDPDRLSRLLLAGCLAFLWTVSVGSQVFHTPLQRLVDRVDRTDRSFFQLGYRYLKRLLKLGEPVWLCFVVNPKWYPRPLTL